MARQLRLGDKPFTKLNPIKELYARIKNDIGVDQGYLKSKILPEWWDDSAALNPSALAEAKLIIARGAGIDLRSLMSTAASVKFAECGNTKFKKTSLIQECDLTAAKTIAWKTLEIACAATTAPIGNILGRTPLEIRQGMLSAGHDCVNLDNLITWCWSNGAPVIHVSDLPRAVKKMDGLAACIDGRGGIVISRNQHCSAWLLFILAHEIGHLALNHLGEQGVLVDEKLVRRDTDAEETQATRFAFQLLTGSDEITFKVTHRLKASQLAEKCVNSGKAHGIEPGVLALMYAYQENFIPVGVAAANIITPDDDAPERIRNAATVNLDEDVIGEERFSLLRRMNVVN